MIRKKCRVKLIATVTAFINFDAKGEPVDFDELDEIKDIEEFEVIDVIF